MEYTLRVDVLQTNAGIKVKNVKVRRGTGNECPGGEYSYICTLFLTLALAGVDGQRHVPAALPPGKRADTHCVGGLGPGTVLNGCRCWVNTEYVAMKGYFVSFGIYFFY
jgi:hypothetical protein